MREWIEIASQAGEALNYLVLPRMREWIEIAQVIHIIKKYYVLPRMREWIEITHTPSFITELKRSPSYEGVD